MKNIVAVVLMVGLSGIVGCGHGRQLMEGSPVTDPIGVEPANPVSLQRNYPSYSEYWFAGNTPPDRIEFSRSQFWSGVKVYAHEPSGTVHQLPDYPARFTVNGNTVVVEGLRSRYNNVSSIQIAWQ